jgi:hypothetical protein
MCKSAGQFVEDVQKLRHPARAELVVVGAGAVPEPTTSCAGQMISLLAPIAAAHDLFTYHELAEPRPRDREAAVEERGRVPHPA